MLRYRLGFQFVPGGQCSAQFRLGSLVVKDLGLYLLSPDRVSTCLAAASLRMYLSGSFAIVHATPTSKFPLFLCDHTLPTPAAMTQTTLADQHPQTGHHPPRTDAGLAQVVVICAPYGESAPPPSPPPSFTSTKRTWRDRSWSAWAPPCWPHTPRCNPPPQHPSVPATSYSRAVSVCVCECVACVAVEVRLITCFLHFLGAQRRGGGG